MIGIRCKVLCSFDALPQASAFEKRETRSPSACRQTSDGCKTRKALSCICFHSFIGLGFAVSLIVFFSLSSLRETVVRRGG